MTVRQIQPGNCSLRALLVVSVSFIFIFGIASMAFSADCLKCGDLQNQGKAYAKDLDSSNVLLEKNKKYLATLSPDDTSKKVKISSNILILNTRIETLSNNMALGDQEQKKQGCEQCQMTR